MYHQTIGMNDMKNPIPLLLIFPAVITIQVHGSLGQNEQWKARQIINKKTSSGASKKEIRHLAMLVNERLSYMKDVAAYKWDNDLEIEDLEREKIVLQQSQQSAEAYRLNPLSTYHFFETQISLSKKIQRHWFSVWEKEGFHHYPYRDLTAEVRPELIRLGDEILQSIKKLQLWKYSKHRLTRWKSVFIQEITIKKITTEEKEKLFESILQIRSAQ